MLRIIRVLGTAALALVLYVGLAACGGNDGPSSGAPQDPQSQATSVPTDLYPDGDSEDDPEDDPGNPLDRPTSIPTSTATAAVGLPTDFPTAGVPVLPGVVTGKTGPAPDGPRGWIVEMSVTGSQKSCFEKASAALIANGFTQQGEITAADTRQAQFTSPEYAVILSVRADGNELCQASYEVGEIAD